MHNLHIKKRQRGFAMIQVLVLTILVVGIIYASVISQNSQAMNAEAQRVAIEVAPAAYALMNYANEQASTIKGKNYYGDEYIVSDDYSDELSDLGYSITGGVTATYSTSTTTTTVTY